MKQKTVFLYLLTISNFVVSEKKEQSLDVNVLIKCKEDPPQLKTNKLLLNCTNKKFVNSCCNIGDGTSAICACEYVQNGPFLKPVCEWVKNRELCEKIEEEEENDDETVNENRATTEASRNILNLGRRTQNVNKTEVSNTTENSEILNKPENFENNNKTTTDEISTALPTSNYRSRNNEAKTINIDGTNHGGGSLNQKLSFAKKPSENNQTPDFGSIQINGVNHGKGNMVQELYIYL